MLEMLFSYWWAVLPILAVFSYYGVRFWAERKFDSAVQDILAETQSDFARGTVEIHSVEAVRTLKVQDETAILYAIDATISPSDEHVEWSGADLFLRGTNGNPNEIGDLMTLKLWNGTTFEAIKNKSQLSGPQRLLLSMRYCGKQNEVQFNFNFANFGPAFELPELAVGV
ncbi:hypothetical protein AB1L42_16225 [Thalassoglobus sp. JC818]|uniref:hypothetical protein n=1 Tax=Thalassoglobus sp. JC818 TaxID=3232136 RepID=UPI0034588350